MTAKERFIIRPARLVKRSRIRAYATICFVVVVAEYLFSLLTGKGLLDRFGQVKGTDFIQFYVAGQLVAAGRGSELYRFVPPFTFPVQFAAEAAVLNGQLAHPNFAFVVPPFFALVMVPFAQLPYLWALAAWILFNVALLVGTLRLLTPYVGLLQGRDRRLVYLAAVSFFPFLECLFDGQNGVISLFFVGLAYVALRRERDTLAGLALAGMLFKPQLVVTLALALLVTRRWRVILGLAAGGLLLVAVSWLIVGPAGMTDYLALSATMPGWIYLPGWRVWNMHSWQSFFVLLFPNPLVSRALSAVFSIGTLGVVGWAWWGHPATKGDGSVVVEGQGRGRAVRSLPVGTEARPYEGESHLPSGSEAGVALGRGGPRLPARGVERGGAPSPNREPYLQVSARPHPNPLPQEREIGGGGSFRDLQHPAPNTLFNLQFSIAAVGTVLVSPHVFAYDLSLLIVPGLLLADLLASGELARLGAGEVTRSALRFGLALTFFAPLISRFLAMGLHLQLSVLVIAGLFVASALALREASADNPVVSIALSAAGPGSKQVETDRATTPQIPSPRGRGLG